ncbi:MAG: MAP7 domain-containing protein [Candidatus Omnitrophica bacterium]|nr:MAP7 domain-containing protein [Candidatus Omnitrophota bacterium]
MFAPYIPKARAQSVLALPTAGTMVSLSPAFTPTILRGIRVYPDNPLKFDFIVDAGDEIIENEEASTRLAGPQGSRSKFAQADLTKAEGFRKSGAHLKAESEKLIKYFLAALTIPEDNLWVNLSPHEQDRIIPDSLGSTDMGTDMLAQDYILKQITASLIYPEDELGKQFWQEIYKKAYEEYGTTNIPVDTFNKVWIMPQKAEVYVKEDRAFVVESRLKVMLEEDYVALTRASETLSVKRETQDSSQDTLHSSQNKLASDVVREIIIPALEKEVNTGKNFAQLCQIYNSLILAYWFKNNLKESIVNKVYSDQSKIKGVDTKDVSQDIYDQYVDSFKKGVCDFIKVEYDEYDHKNIPRKYFSGGETFSKFYMKEAVKFTDGDTPDGKRAGSAIGTAIKKSALVALVTFQMLGLRQDSSRFVLMTPEHKWMKEHLPVPLYNYSTLKDFIPGKQWFEWVKEYPSVALDYYPELKDFAFKRQWVKWMKEYPYIALDNYQELKDFVSEKQWIEWAKEYPYAALDNHRDLQELDSSDKFFDGLAEQNPIEAFQTRYKAYVNLTEKELQDECRKAVARDFLDFFKLPNNENNLERAVNLVIHLEDHVADTIVFGRGIKVINLANIESQFSLEEMEAFEISANVDSSDIKSFKGGTEEIINRLIERIEKTPIGALRIFYRGHANKKNLGPGNFTYLQYKRLGDALIARGDVEHVMFLNFSCFSFNFIENLASYLRSQGVASQAMFSDADENRKSFGRESDFFQSLVRHHKPGTPVRMRVFWEARELNVLKKQKPAIFYSFDTKYLKEVIPLYFPKVDVEKLDFPYTKPIGDLLKKPNIQNSNNFRILDQSYYAILNGAIAPIKLHFNGFGMENTYYATNFDDPRAYKTKSQEQIDEEQDFAQVQIEKRKQKSEKYASQRNQSIFKNQISSSALETQTKAASSTIIPQDRKSQQKNNFPKPIFGAVQKLEDDKWVEWIPSPSQISAENTFFVEGLSFEQVKERIQELYKSDISKPILIEGAKEGLALGGKLKSFIVNLGGVKPLRRNVAHGFGENVRDLDIMLVPGGNGNPKKIVLIGRDEKGEMVGLPRIFDQEAKRTLSLVESVYDSFEQGDFFVHTGLFYSMMSGKISPGTPMPEKKEDGKYKTLKKDTFHSFGSGLDGLGIKIKKSQGGAVESVDFIEETKKMYGQTAKLDFESLRILSLRDQKISEIEKIITGVDNGTFIIEADLVMGSRGRPSENLLKMIKKAEKGSGNFNNDRFGLSDLAVFLDLKIIKEKGKQARYFFIGYDAKGKEITNYELDLEAGELKRPKRDLKKEIDQKIIDIIVNAKPGTYVVETGSRYIGARDTVVPSLPMAIKNSRDYKKLENEKSHHFKSLVSLRIEIVIGKKGVIEYAIIGYDSNGKKLGRHIWDWEDEIFSGGKVNSSEQIVRLIIPHLKKNPLTIQQVKEISTTRIERRMLYDKETQMWTLYRNDPRGYGRAVRGLVKEEIEFKQKLSKKILSKLPSNSFTYSQERIEQVVETLLLLNGGSLRFLVEKGVLTEQNVQGIESLSMNKIGFSKEHGIHVGLQKLLEGYNTNLNKKFVKDVGGKKKIIDRLIETHLFPADYVLELHKRFGRLVTPKVFYESFLKSEPEKWLEEQSRLEEEKRVRQKEEQRKLKEAERARKAEEAEEQKKLREAERARKAEEAEEQKKLREAERARKAEEQRKLKEGARAKRVNRAQRVFRKIIIKILQKLEKEVSGKPRYEFKELWQLFDFVQSIEENLELSGNEDTRNIFLNKALGYIPSEKDDRIEPHNFYNSDYFAEEPFMRSIVEYAINESPFLIVDQVDSDQMDVLTQEVVQQYTGFSKRALVVLPDGEGAILNGNSGVLKVRKSQMYEDIESYLSRADIGNNGKGFDLIIIPEAENMSLEEVLFLSQFFKKNGNGNGNGIRKIIFMTKDIAAENASGEKSGVEFFREYGISGNIVKRSSSSLSKEVKQQIGILLLEYASTWRGTAIVGKTGFLSFLKEKWGCDYDQFSEILGITKKQAKSFIEKKGSVGMSPKNRYIFLERFGFVEDFEDYLLTSQSPKKK